MVAGAQGAGNLVVHKDALARPDKVPFVQHQAGKVPIGGIRSQSEREVTLVISGSKEEIILPVRVSTRVSVVKDMLANKLGMSSDKLTFVAKEGSYFRVQLDTAEIRARVMVKGITSFKRQRKEYAHPHCIIGAGYNGLRQGLWFIHDQCENFVIFDRRERVGGNSWTGHANVFSKVQTEFGTYHLNWSKWDQCPKGVPAWPSRDQLLKHFDDVCDSYGLRSFMRLSTDVKKFDIAKPDPGSGGSEQTYNLQVETTDENKTQSNLRVSSVLLYPGNLTIPRREEYPGEDSFGGIISYGMFDEVAYETLKGTNVAVCGFGAFAVENVRTCVENQAGKIFLIARRKNLCMPRMVSWWINSSIYAVPASDILHRMERAYKDIDDDPWSYYAVSTNDQRTQAQIKQKARFGIGDVYFLARQYGKLELVIDIVKKLTRGAMHLESGRRIELSAILKLFGFVADFGVDKFMQVKELTGIWCDKDYRRATVSEFPSMNATKFGGTSLAPGAHTWGYMVLHQLNFPFDFYKMMDTGMVPTNKKDPKKETPVYVMDAQHGQMVMITIYAANPACLEGEGITETFKREKQWGTHSLKEIHAEAKAEWDRYCQFFYDSGDHRPFPPYLFGLDEMEEMIETQDREGKEAKEKQDKRMAQN